MVCVTRGGLELYLYCLWVGTELGVSCTQVSPVCLSSMRSRGLRDCKGGRPVSPRPAGLGMWPSGHHLCVDVPDHLLRSVAVAWLQRRQLEADRPHLGRLAWVWLVSGLLCSVTLVTSCTLFLKSVWVLTLWFVTGIGPNLTWFKPFGLDL